MSFEKVFSGEQPYYLHLGDCLAYLKTLPPNSISAVVTDPPYYSTNLHFDKSERVDFQYLLTEYKRVLKPTGILISFADFNLLAELRSYKVFKSTYELIWQKTMAVGFFDANIRPLRAHEFVGVFTDSLKQSTYNPQKIQGSPYKKNRAYIEAQHYSKTKRISTENNSGLYHPKSVLEFSNGNFKSEHPTKKPLDLLEWLVKTYTNLCDVILDPFTGSGTTGVACMNLNRRFIGCELYTPYFEIAKNRIDQALNEPKQEELFNDSMA